MNIRSRYYPGIRLSGGKYDILVEHPGYKSYREWVNLGNAGILQLETGFIPERAEVVEACVRVHFLDP